MTELKFTKRNLETDTTEFLRSQGRVPAICYGSGFENTPVSVDDIEFRKVYRHLGTSGIITTSGDIAGEQCLTQDMQVHVVSGKLLHIDFRMLKKGEKSVVTVPVEFVGKSLGIENKVGILNIRLDEIEIETIPSKIPNHIEVDISSLVKLGDSIKVSDLKLDSAITILEDLNTTIVILSAPQEQKEEEEEESDVAMEPELVDQKGGEEKEAE
jgi:large subunit ribosomal protein L25